MPDYFNFLCVYFNCCVKYCFVIGVVRVVATTICSHNKFHSWRKSQHNRVISYLSCTLHILFMCNQFFVIKALWTLFLYEVINNEIKFMRG